MDDNVQETIRLVDEAALNLSLARGVIEGAAVVTPEEAVAIDQKLQGIGTELRAMRRESARVDGQLLQDWQIDVLGALMSAGAYSKRPYSDNALTKRQVTKAIEPRKGRYPHYQTKNWLSLVKLGLVKRYREKGLFDLPPDREWRWFVTELGSQLHVRAANLYESRSK
jgi:hypothetical protein